MSIFETDFEHPLLARLADLNYIPRHDIHDLAALEANFREKFAARNWVKLTNDQFAGLLGDTVTLDVYTAAHALRHRNSLRRDDGTPLNYTLVNISDWCKSTFGVINQLKINTDSSYHRHNLTR